MTTPFQEKVYELTRQIPRGKVTTYACIARKLGCRAYRAVGNALKRNPYAPEVPCHRVVKSDGSIGGFARGIAEKAMMLRKEGITIRKGRILNFSKIVHIFT